MPFFRLPPAPSFKSIVTMPFIACAIFALASSTSARAQVSFSGVANGGNFGSQAIALPSAPSSFQFTVQAGTKVGSVAVTTTGVANLDFANAASTTCVVKTYSSLTTCQVNVTFTPQVAGLRMGAVVFFSGANNSGTILASVPAYGIGAGPQIAYGQGAATAIDRTIAGRAGLENPSALAVDAAGNLFVLDAETEPTNYRLMKIPANGATPTSMDPSVNGQSLYLPSSIAIDGAGDIFIGDFCRRVIEIPAGGGAATAIEPIANGIPINYPSGLALDGAGNLFISDFLNNRIVEVPAGGGAPIAIDPEVNGIALDDPHGLALDGVGNVYIADLGNERVVKVPYGGGVASAIQPNVNGESLASPEAIALDGAGDLFIADNLNHRVVEVPAGGRAPLAIDPDLYFTGLGAISAVNVDGSGDLFLVQGGLEGDANLVEEMQYSQSPSLSFPTITAMGATDGTDGALTVQVINVGNGQLVLSGMSYPADFSQASGDPNSCDSSTALNPGQACDVTVEFTPMNSGSLSESITLTDNALNGAPAQQLVAVGGTGEQPAGLIAPQVGSVLAGPTVTFTWTAAPGATGYYLSLGSTGVGSSNVYNTGKRTVTSMTATGLPTNGETIYARLTTYYGSMQMHSDYVFQAATQAVMTSPAPGGILSGPVSTFAWSAGSYAPAYILYLGTTGAGSSNLYNSGQVNSLSVTYSSIPTNGETIYARLITIFSGAQSHLDYVYTASSQATMTLPAPGTLLSGTGVAFSWTAGSGASGYTLWLGSSGLGSNNLYNSGLVTGTTVTASGLPINGETVYARLFTTLNGSQVHIDYNYSASMQAAITSPAPGAVLPGTTGTFNWTAATGATSYKLSLGTAGAGSADLYNSGTTTATTATASSLPANGVTVYARLVSKVNGAEVSADYTYIAATPAAMASPASGTVLAGSATTFRWTAGGGATSYTLWLGSTGVGSSNVYKSIQTAATSITATGLPTNGETIYARLFTNFTGGQLQTDYTYMAVTQASLVLPAAGTVLTTSSIPFTWTAGNGATGYYLSLGNTGVGSTNVFNTGRRTATSWTATGVPATGETIYVRLTTYYTNGQSTADYTFYAATPASLISPARGSMLLGSNVPFTWSTGSGATGYYLSLGSTGVGSSNIFNTGVRTVTSWTATGVPMNGETIYVRLTTYYPTGKSYADYTYTAK